MKVLCRDRAGGYGLLMKFGYLNIEKGIWLH